MATSGTYAFNPGAGSLTLEALGLIGIAPAAILPKHMNSARLQANMLLQEWANRGVNLFKIDEQTQTLVAGTTDYTLSGQTVEVLDAFIRTTDGTTNIDRTILPISRSDWAAIPNKAMQAQPTTFWFERLVTPVMHLWPSPDDTTTYTLHYYRVRKFEDVAQSGGTTLDMPTRFLDAFVTGLAYRLAKSYAQNLEAARKQDYSEAWGFAASEDVENAPMRVTPGLGAYYR